MDVHSVPSTLREPEDRRKRRRKQPAGQDGREALRAARELDPDVIVLDINMPGLDGFRTRLAHQQQGSRARIVFLSLLEDDELLNEAFRCGGRGYVIKSQMTRDPASAVDQVLAGRLFAPSLTTIFRFTEGRGHAMHVHGEEEAFLDGLAAVLEWA
jgi:DNA-binding NarL/FixJ family response regulator